MKSISNFPGYYITKDGRVWSGPKKGNSHRGQWLKPIINLRGYCIVNLYQDKKEYTRYIHRLVLEAFIGPCPDNMEACHGNGIKVDNRLENLRWDTHSGNQLDAVKHGTHVDTRGEKHGRAKLNNMKVRVIRRMLEQGGFTQREIAGIFGVNSATISYIKHGVSWVLDTH